MRGVQGLRLDVSATLQDVLPALRGCISQPDLSRDARAALIDKLRELETTRPTLIGVASEFEKAADRHAVLMAAATAMRRLMQVLDDDGPEEDEVVSRSERARERRISYQQRRQSQALAADKKAPGSSRDRPVESLPGVGKVSGVALRARGVDTVGDLVWLLPLGYRDERRVLSVDELEVGVHQVTAGEVVSVRGGRRMAQVTLKDLHGDAQLRLVWFNSPPGLLARFTEGARFRIAGEVQTYRGELSITHAQTKLIPEGEAPEGGGIVPRYPPIPGVAPRALSKAIGAAVERAAQDMVGAVPPSVLATEELPTLAQALAWLHAPPLELDDAQLLELQEQRAPAQRRLAFEEFFMLELALHRRRVEEQGVVAEALSYEATALERARGALGFELTSAQRRVVAEIDADMGEARPMRRLLQGDVGSGKTAVAMLAAARAVAAGGQVAFMAPTEILAEQHFRSLQPVAEAMGVRCALVLGGARAAHRKATRKALVEGRLDLAVGTHALLTEGVVFNRLRLVIVDEQHRFGVGQRLRLVDKSHEMSPHLLVMTATPIPRTLTLALHGDLGSSVLDELPPGRIPPVTRAYAITERDRALHQLERALEKDGQAYVVCPVIEESEDTELRTAEEAYRELSQRFARWGVGLLHGRLPSAEKQRAMDSFVAGETRVLVSTTVIEVGVDVARANVMLIEHAERFGLAQLHQLRGRVGRAGQPSACLLVHDAKGEEARARVAILCESHDGFRIAEEDLRLRGPGELFGRRQSGLPGFRFGDLRRDGPLLERARDAAQRVIEVDPELLQHEHAAARVALDRLADSPHAVVKEEAG